eukprot:tig00021432_g21194.t1
MTMPRARVFGALAILLALLAPAACAPAQDDDAPAPPPRTPTPSPTPLPCEANRNCLGCLASPRGCSWCPWDSSCVSPASAPRKYCMASLRVAGDTCDGAVVVQRPDPRPVASPREPLWALEQTYDVVWATTRIPLNTARPAPAPQLPHGQRRRPC